MFADTALLSWIKKHTPKISSSDLRMLPNGVGHPVAQSRIVHSPNSHSATK
jgi:hypothetical protein